MKLHASGEDYLEAILIIERKSTVRSIDVGVDEETAEKDACLLEHSLSDDIFSKLKKAADSNHKQKDK